MMQRAGDTVIDVRTPEEYAQEHIEGAVNIPIETLDTAELPEGTIVTTCASGGRAKQAAETLVEAGRMALYIDGGTNAWREAGFPVTVGGTPS